MSDSIFLLNPAGGGLVEMVAEPYDSEDVLQRLLEQHPSLLAGAQMRPDDPRRWLLVQREAGVADRPDGPAQWSVDHLFVCQDAVPTIVEVKRASDTRLRREVVGQMLDYAANGVLHWPDGRLRELHASSAGVDGADPNDAVLALIGSDDPADVDRFWEQVDANLRSGRVRMVFVADVIPDRLRRIVEFLNEAMTRAEVFAVAVPQYNGKGHQALVPRLIGNSTRAQDAKRARSRSDHPGFAVLLEEADDATKSVVAKVDQLAAQESWPTRQDNPASARWDTANGTIVAENYPTLGSGLVLHMKALIDADAREPAESLRSNLSSVVGRDLPRKRITLSNAEVLDHWTAVAEVMRELGHAIDQLKVAP
ncbi:MAG: hypothetical protein AB7W59_28810 [Acidimicrobiia bacterium]